jgi:outer membrane translocation and assembly module TamA
MRQLFSCCILLYCAVVMAAQSAPPTQSESQNWSKPNKILLQEFSVSGTRSLDNTELNELTSSLSGLEYNRDEISERIRDAFQRRGYFDAEVKHLEIKALDPLARPKPVRVEAEVAEGQRYRLGDIEIRGYRAFTLEQLRAAIPFHANDYFGTEKVRVALGALHKTYVSAGYIDAMSVPSTTKGSDATISLRLNIHEGSQYRMGDLEFFGDQDHADQLRSKWKLSAGEVYDGGYPEKFVDENRALLPGEGKFTGYQTVQNCREHTVAVQMSLDPKHSLPATKKVGCDGENREAKEAAEEKTGN